ncbi:MAG TPA: right-handed parallel beta-helix repeat-containing protein [Bacillota bacterium]|nr:right-handed parallel beta-helix repeat-containing protein [Bacillota bacterium]
MTIKNIGFILVSVLLLSVLMFGCSSNSTSPNTSQDDITFQAAGSYTVTTYSDLKTRISNAVAGDVITISGTIRTSSNLSISRSGSSSAMITLKGGCLDFSGCSSYGLNISGSYWRISGIEIKNDGDTPVYITGSRNIIENCNIHNNQDMGLLIRHGGAYNQVNGCQSHDNYDTANGGENADGFGCKWEGGSSNVFNNCNASYNSDDGWDLWMYTSPVKINSCQAHYNGKGTAGDGNGFKLGGNNVAANHTLTNCVANYNTGYGYCRNNNPGTITLSNCTGTGNKKGLKSGL